ncbi:retrovirus-related pol polyprotein from transposon TNT 1-94 [Tanacetum coccineum]
MPLTFQPHSPKERPGLGIMKHTKPETQDSSNKSVSGTVTVSETKQTTPLVPTEVKDTEQESKLNELTKLVQMLIDEKVNSNQKTQESNSKIQKTESSKSVDSSKISQDSKPNVSSTSHQKSLRPKPIQKPQLKCELCHYTNHSTDDCYRILYCMICKREDHRTSDHEMYIASLKRSENYKAQPYQYASSSKQILKAKAKPFPPCTHCGFNDHIPDDCRNYPECEICGSYDHSTSGHNRVIQIRGGVLAESSQSNESSIRVKCNTCGSTVHSTSDHNEFDHFKRETHQGAHLVPGQWMLKEYDWCQELSAQICRATRMVENQNDVKVKQTRTDNGNEFRNHELETERKNKTLIEAARTMLNGSILSKHFLTRAVRIACYTQNRSIIVKRHDKTSNEIFKERIPDINYFHVFGCLVFIHNHKDYLGKFNAKTNDGYFLGYSFVSKAFRVFKIRRQQIKETYHVTFNEKNHVPGVIAPNEPDIPHTKNTEGPPNLINTKGTHGQNVQNDQMITQPTDVPSRNNTKVSGSITESLVPDVTQSYISNQASTSSHPIPQDRWSRDQHIELVNIIGDPSERMLTRSMAAKLKAASASECMFADFLSKIELKKVSEALKHLGWIDVMQEELN